MKNMSVFFQEKEKRVKRPRIENYTQTVVSRYMDFEFKSHFRLNIFFMLFYVFILLSFLNTQKRFSITLIEVQINTFCTY